MQAQGGWNYLSSAGVFTDKDIFFSSGNIVAIGANENIQPMAPTVWTFKGNGLVTNNFRLLYGTASHLYWEFGAIVEIIFKDGTETLGEQQRIEGYLAHKWGISLVTGYPYEKVAP